VALAWFANTSVPHFVGNAVGIAMPILVIGIIASMRGSTTAFFIALAAAFLLYGAKVFLDVASKMRAAAKEPP
jgi:hypothetical protein